VAVSVPNSCRVCLSHSLRQLFPSLPLLVILHLRQRGVDRGATRGYLGGIGRRSRWNHDGLEWQWWLRRVDVSQACLLRIAIVGEYLAMSEY
jgi:hypothetical protein